MDKKLCLYLVYSCIIYTITAQDNLQYCTEYTENVIGNTI
jgi:hypothetical protein